MRLLPVTLSRCTIQKECAQGLLARSWISMGEGPQQCPSMTLTPPEISISADIKVPSAQYTTESMNLSIASSISCLVYTSDAKTVKIGNACFVMVKVRSLDFFDIEISVRNNWRDQKIYIWGWDQKILTMKILKIEHENSQEIVHSSISCCSPAYNYYNRVMFSHYANTVTNQC